MKWISGSHYFLRLFTSTTYCTVSLWMQVSFLFGTSARICREKLWFDRKNLEIWLVNAGHVKAKGDCKPDLLEQTILVWAYSLVQQTKVDKYSSCYLFLSLSGQVVYFHKADYYCTIWVIIYSYLQKFFNIGVLKTLHNSQKNTWVGVSF